jgi:hypothetical protein
MRGVEYGGAEHSHSVGLSLTRVLARSIGVSETPPDNRLAFGPYYENFAGSHEPAVTTERGISN